LLRGFLPHCHDAAIVTAPVHVRTSTVSVDAGHLSLVSHPREIANLILQAAGQKTLSGS
jgi:hypothetical protein